MSRRLCGIAPQNLVTGRHELIVQSVDLVRLVARDILLMQRSQLILSWLVVEPVVDRPPPLMGRRRMFGATAAWADVPDFTIELRVVLLDLLGQGVFVRRDRAGASDAILACRQIELMIVLVDFLEVIARRPQVILGRLSMTDQSVHRSIDRRSLRVCLRLRSAYNGH